MTMPDNEKSQLVTEATIEIMFDEARQGQSFLSQWADAIDAKVLGVFGAASVLIGAIPAIGGVKANGWEWTPWIIAGVAWACTSFYCWRAYGTQTFNVSPNPSRLLSEEWTKLTPEKYRYYRIRDLGKAWDHNRGVINKKAEALGLALPFIAIESGALLAAMLLQR